MKITNKYNINIVLQLALLYSDYEYDPDPKTFSVTTLFNSLRKLAYYSDPKIEGEKEILEYLASFTGSHTHSLIERVVRNKKLRKEYLKILNKKDRYLVNPSKKQLKKNNKKKKKKKIIWVEKRAKKQFGEFYLTGKFDHTIDGVLYDTKNTKVFAYSKCLKEEEGFNDLLKSDLSGSRKIELALEQYPNIAKYSLQGSLYKLIFPKYIKEKHIIIEFLFKDWSAGFREIRKDYPISPVLEYRIKLFDPEDVEKWVKNRFKTIDSIVFKKTKQIPECSKNELWMEDNTYKYFANPNSTRATRNFKNDATAAYDYLEKQGKGVVKVEQGKASACNYCIFTKHCDQYTRLKKANLIKENKI